jgi:hypothetical protein
MKRAGPEVTGNEQSAKPREDYINRGKDLAAAHNQHRASGLTREPKKVTGETTRVERVAGRLNMMSYQWPTDPHANKGGKETTLSRRSLGVAWESREEGRRFRRNTA